MVTFFGTKNNDDITKFYLESALIGNDILIGDLGNDLLKGFNGNDKIDGGAGNDCVNGDLGNDTINGGAGCDKINGGAGNDYLNGGLGNDTINGGAGCDKINGGAGNDCLNGGLGNDTINGGAGNDKINGGLGNDTINGGAGNDKINGGLGNDKIDGGVGCDKINGGAGNDSLNGGLGNDTINGGAGCDKINGGAGNDCLNGGLGNDTINGGLGDDVIRLGNGKDTVVLASGNGFDSVLDFKNDEDKIQLCGGLAFSDLKIFSQGNNTIITNLITGENLAKLQGVSSQVINIDDFVFENNLRKASGLDLVESMYDIMGEDSEAIQALVNSEELKDVDGTKITSANLLLDANDVDLNEPLKAIYQDIDKFDAFVDIIAENQVQGTEFYELQQAIWTDQFEVLPHGNSSSDILSESNLIAIENSFGSSSENSFSNITDLDREDNALVSTLYLVVEPEVVM